MFKVVLLRAKNTDFPGESLIITKGVMMPSSADIVVRPETDVVPFKEAIVTMVELSTVTT